MIFLSYAEHITIIVKVSWLISAILCSAQIFPWRVTHFFDIITNLRLNQILIVIIFVSKETFSSLAYCNLTLGCVSQDNSRRKCASWYLTADQKARVLVAGFVPPGLTGSFTWPVQSKKEGWGINVVQLPSLSVCHFYVCRVIHN